MVFNSNVFLFAFLPVVFSLFWLSRTKQQRYLVLAVSGYVFYGYWDWRFCFLLLFSSLVSFTAGIMIDRTPSPGARRAWMIASVAVDLSVLGFFKYYDFVAGNLDRLLPGANLPLLHVVLPIGISFYTFHTISYIVDVARGRVRATHDLFEYLAYVSLFSQLVAGPIVRYREIEEDLERIDGPPREDHLARGIGFFVVGLVKKAVIADAIAGWIDPLLAVPASLSTAGAWMAALGYSLQLYYDFSGYSDMAVGLGLMFGLRIPQNFNAPYRALGISDFWHRWHISLSSWLRDYLYIPLGGNRGGSLQTHRNLMLTMILGGLWHGAAWNFAAWGCYHGLLLVGHRLAQPALERVTQVARGMWRTPWFVLRLFIMFHLTCYGWLLFRAKSFAQIAHMTGVLSQPLAAVPVETLSRVAVLCAPVIIVQIIQYRTGRLEFLRHPWLPLAGKAAFYSALLYCALFHGAAPQAFVYFQF